MYIDILRGLRDAVRKEGLKNGESTVGFSFTTMLQNTGEFWSRTT
jgi:hypothetical protein